MTTIGASTHSVLSAMRTNSRAIEQAQTRIATGLKINSAADGASVWATAQNLRSEISSAEGVRKGLGKTASTAMVTSASLAQLKTVTMQIRATIAGAAGKTAAEKEAAQATVAGLQNQLKSIVASSSTGGTNWLDGTTTTIAVNISTDGNTALSQAASALNMIDGAAGGVLDKNGATFVAGAVTTYDISTATDADIAKMLTDVDTAIGKISTAAASVTFVQSQTERMNDFMASLVSIKQDATKALTAADVDEEAAKLAEYQTRQSLAYQALAILNQQQQNILALFSRF